MMDTLDHPVKILMRIRIGDIKLGRIPEGQFAPIDEEIIQKMKKECYERKANNTYMMDDEEEEQ